VNSLCSGLCVVGCDHHVCRVLLVIEGSAGGVNMAWRCVIGRRPRGADWYVSGVLVVAVYPGYMRQGGRMQFVCVTPSFGYGLYRVEGLDGGLRRWKQGIVLYIIQSISFFHGEGAHNSIFFVFPLQAAVFATVLAPVDDFVGFRAKPLQVFHGPIGGNDCTRRFGGIQHAHRDDFTVVAYKFEDSFPNRGMFLLRFTIIVLWKKCDDSQGLGVGAVVVQEVAAVCGCKIRSSVSLVCET
jgi:hypothetical protein